MRQAEIYGSDACLLRFDGFADDAELLITERRAAAVIEIAILIHRLWFNA